MDALETASTILRIWLGVVILAHGINHSRNMAGTTKWFAEKGFRNARMNALGASLGELAIGAGLIVGLLTTPAAAGLAAMMTVAFGAIHRFSGFFVFARPDEGYEYVATVTVGAIVLGLIGPGPWSLDAVVGLDTALDGFLGAGIVVAGIVVGFLQLGATWRKPAAGS